MKKTLVILTLMAAAALFPGALQAQQETTAVAGSVTWVPGHWTGGGSEPQWVAGYYTTCAPTVVIAQPAPTYVPARWVWTNGGWTWVEAHYVQSAPVCAPPAPQVVYVAPQPVCEPVYVERPRSTVSVVVGGGYYGGGYYGGGHHGHHQGHGHRTHRSHVSLPLPPLPRLSHLPSLPRHLPPLPHQIIGKLFK